MSNTATPTNAEFTKEAVQSMSHRALTAIGRSTSPNGRHWMALVWAKDELARRASSGQP